MTPPRQLLFLGAAPTDEVRLALGREMREIAATLRESEGGRAITVKQDWAVRSTDLQPLFLRHLHSADGAPRTIVHFSGHGSQGGELILEDDSGKARPVPVAALGELFSLFRGRIEGVLLNACYSEPQGEALRPHLDWVIGMKRTVPDRAAIAFASSFYLGLGYGVTAEQAFAMGCTQIKLLGISGADVPVLLGGSSKVPPGRADPPRPPRIAVDDDPEGVAPMTPAVLPSSSTTEPRAVVLTALPVEYLAVLAHLTDVVEVQHPSGTVYERGRLMGDGAAWEVIVAEIGPGNAGAALEAERAVQQFKPRIILFVGVAGGLKDVALGDVVAATKVYGYEAGKAKSAFAPRPEVHRSAHALEQRARAEARRPDWRQRIASPPAGQEPRVFVAPIAAGEKVVASRRAAVAKFLRQSYGDAVAVEMEGIGFLAAAHANPSVLALVVRGVSDLLDQKARSDGAGWQERAARNAAAFALTVLGRLDGSPSRDTDLPPAAGPRPKEAAAPTTPPAPSSLGAAPASRGESESEKDRRRLLEEVIATIADWLGKRPKVAAKVAKHLALRATGPAAQAAEIVRERSALEVAGGLNAADFELQGEGADLEDRRVIRSLLFQILPFAVDWIEFVARQRATGADAAGFDLPFRSETVAGVVLAGIDERPCQFTGTDPDGMPVVAGQVSVPAVALHLFATGGVRATEGLVEHLAAQLRITGTEDEKLSKVRALLRSRADRRIPDQYLPYYLLLDENDPAVGGERGEGFTLVRRAVGQTIPSLKVHRLTGTPVEDHYLLAYFIGQLLNRPLPKDPR